MPTAHVISRSDFQSLILSLGKRLATGFLNLGRPTIERFLRDTASQILSPFTESVMDSSLAMKERCR